MLCLTKQLTLSTNDVHYEKIKANPDDLVNSTKYFFKTTSEYRLSNPMTDNV